jgi:hypothetical protein
MDDFCTLINLGFHLLSCPLWNNFTRIGIKEETSCFRYFFLKRAAILLAIFVDLSQLRIENQLWAEMSSSPVFLFFNLKVNEMGLGGFTHSWVHRHQIVWLDKLTFGIVLTFHFI